MNIDKIIAEIDKSQMNYDFYDMFNLFEELELGIHNINEPENIKISFCYYWSWMCTDTYVGIRVWYYNNESVAISFQPYRKSKETFYWINKYCFDKVYKYVLSLCENQFEYLTIQEMPDIIEQAKSIDYKEFEKLNNYATND